MSSCGFTVVEALVSAFRSCVAAPVAVILLVEILKSAIIVKAYAKSADGNVIGAIVATEGGSFLADAAVVFATVFPYDSSRAPALFAVSATFILARLVSSVALSHILHK